MKIFQISDLHLEENFNIEEYNDMLEKMIETIAVESKDIDDVHIVCCGDIVNKGNSKEYKNSANQVFDFIKNKLKNKRIEFICVPGNHDLCNNNFEEFQQFFIKYNKSINFISNNVCTYETPYIDYVVLNTTFHRDISYGKVDLIQLKESLQRKTKPTIVVMHHALMSRYSNDRSSISDAYEFLKQLEINQVIGILHGHTHGYSNMLVGDNCRVIGVGSLFEYFKNCSNQFNVIEIGARAINRVENYRYHSDLKDLKKEILYVNSQHNYFECDKASDIYMQVKESVKYHGGINNLSMVIKSDLHSYKKDMEEQFYQDIDTAKLWLEETVPSSLYYNHGEYMVSGNIKGINYIIEELNRNSTSNRAIIPLIHFSDVLKNRFSYLPGLNSVQFGFVNDEKVELNCSVYLRSLEVSRFLGINLSEIYILASRICDEIRSIKRINIHLYAFKAQYKEDFSCFKKASIDTISSGELAHIVYKEPSKIFELLKNKFEMNETVINTSGLELLLDVMNASKNYNSRCINELKSIIDRLKELELEFSKNSDYNMISPLEESITLKQEAYLSMLMEELVDF